MAKCWDKRHDQSTFPWRGCFGNKVGRYYSSSETVFGIHQEFTLYRSVVEKYFLTYEIHLIRQRKHRRLQRKRFWAAGVNDLLCVDQHDKWKKYGLALHTGIEPFVGRIQWLKIWWGNSNPRLILSYHLDTIETQGCKLFACLRTYCKFCWYLTSISVSHVTCYSERSGTRELWDCQWTDHASSLARSSPKGHFTAPMDAREEKHHAWDSLVAAEEALHSWVWEYPRAWGPRRVVQHCGHSALVRGMH